MIHVCRRRCARLGRAHHFRNGFAMSDDHAQSSACSVFPMLRAIKIPLCIAAAATADCTRAFSAR